MSVPAKQQACLWRACQGSAVCYAAHRLGCLDESSLFRGTKLPFPGLFVLTDKQCTLTMTLDSAGDQGTEQFGVLIASKQLPAQLPGGVPLDRVIFNPERHGLLP